MNVLVSAIIPVYNAEKFLIECIESLRNQILSEIEMIFINDGSTDNSLEILREYEKLDSRIIVIDQENKGPSEARNEGIRIAKGEYISFIDADDWIHKDMYKEMYQSAIENNSDCVICDMTRVSENNEVYISGAKLKIPLYDKEKVSKYIYPELLSNSQFNSAANKLYKSQIIKSHNITFNKEIYYAEDWLFNVDFFQQVSNAGYINQVFYYYRRGHESSSSSYDDNTFERTGIWIYNMRKKIAKKLNINPFLATGDLYKVLIHCIISEFRRKDIDFCTKTQRVNEILRKPEVNEVINYRHFELISKKDYYLFYCVKHKLSLFLYLYVLLGNLKEFMIKREKV